MKRRSTEGPTLADVGESRLIALLTKRLPADERVRVGAGDDCAVIGGARDARLLLLKTDATVEGVHFLATEDARRVGWKALCRAISDIAAMGGQPEHALIALALAPEVSVAWVKSLYVGIRRAAKRFGVSIVGGETARSPGPRFISVCLTGSVSRRQCILRSGGKPGDAIYVTGKLGGSLGSGRHLDFTPRLAEGRWLAANFPPTAMMDLSDGLAADLPRLAAASGCGSEIWEGALPLHLGVTARQAQDDGEDFELLFTMPPRRCARLEAAWHKEFPRLPLTRVGELTAARTKSKTRTGGHDHFQKSC